MDIIPFVTDSLGDSSYLLVAGDVAAVIDPQRDVRPYREAAAARNAAITHVFETHVHNDYVSGGRELAALGATIVAPAASGLQFPHQPVADGDEVAIGHVRIRAVAAPGHTYEHTAYVATGPAGSTTAAFTGGSLLVASAGRTDLLGPDHTDELTRMQWATAHRLASLLPDGARVLPTHGAGSFCSATDVGGQRTTTLAAERAVNPALLPEYDEFRSIHLAALPPIPTYYKHMAPINRAGPKVYGDPPRPPMLDPGALEALVRTSVRVVDVRDRHAFARAHIAGSVLLEESASMLAYAGWVLPFNTPLALVTTDAAQADRVTTNLLRIAYEDVRGYLPFDVWQPAGRPVAQLDALDVSQARAAIRAGRPVIDVRFDYEQDATPIPSAVRRPIDHLSEWLGDPGAESPLIVCASGERASIAASFLAAAGRPAAFLIDGGAEDLR